MKVKLISKTQAVNMPGAKNPGDLVSYCARVSNPSNQANFQTAAKLLKYCFQHGHVSIFEMADFTFEIVTSRAISAQILRHRHFNFQEFSQRYAEATEFEAVDVRMQDPKNRQMSLPNADFNLEEWFQLALKKIQIQAEESYRTALTKGIAKEQARFMLPLNTRTVLYMKGSLRSWIHYLAIRTKMDTQKEHREIALAIKDILAKEVPYIIDLLEDYSVVENNPYD